MDSPRSPGLLLLFPDLRGKYPWGTNPTPQMKIGKQRTGKDMSTGPSPRDVTRETAGGAEVLTQHTKVILAATQESKMALENQIAMLVGEVGLLREDHIKLKDQVKATEDMMSEMAPQVKALMQKLTIMNNEMRTLAIKVEDAESRSRRHSIRLVGVPEKTGGPSPELRRETWLSDLVLGAHQLNSSLWSGHTGFRQPLCRRGRIQDQ
ncbi:hypothetical protein NDU88_005650 [Pleurodeles waltl]|uniref:Uncharacterized protein n=1 Tax=Pleurodeles waltl TaxID=8319 RepID=A0AAV7VLQ2_PLEWA|nr:hypothetical protein NDU88_005650 [Pleurodeles waltl]